uniref:Thioredoxin domain-containing protein n=1 Tax=Spongospora subterranea TaxID=70186 RepID=A0A0H5R9Q5_9EUKA|eukprot:CRZ10526.1 hypothetical protein [Spongospora subterranea]
MTCLPATITIWALLFSLLTLTVLADKFTSDSIVSLDEENYKSLVVDNPNRYDWLIVFYTTWCGACNVLAPELVAASADHSDSSTIKFGSVDYDKQPALSTLHDVRGFPTVKIIRDNITVNYGGARTKEAINAFINDLSQPSVQKYVAHDQKSDPYFVLYADESFDSDSPTVKAFYDAARHLQLSQVNSYRVYEDVPTPVVRKFTAGSTESEEYVIGDSSSSALIAQWMFDHKDPLVAELGISNFLDLVHRKEPLVILTLNPKDEQTFTSTLKIFRQAASRFQGDHIFTWIDVKWQDWLKTFNVDFNVPTLFVYDYNMERHWPSQPSVTQSPDSILNFLGDVQSGRVSFVGPSAYHPAYILRSISQYIKTWDTTTIVASAGVAIVGVILVWFLTQKPNPVKEKST